MINSQEIYSKLEMGIKDIDADRENLIEAIITRLKESAENENISQEERDTIKEQYIALKDFRVFLPCYYFYLDFLCLVISTKNITA